MATHKTRKTDSHRSRSRMAYYYCSRAENTASLKKLSEFLFISRVYKLTMGIFLAMVCLVLKDLASLTSPAFFP